MNASSGVSPVTVALAAAVILLASSTAYLGMLVLLPRTGTGVYPGNVVSVYPSNGPAVGSSPAGASPANSITVVGTGQVSYTPNEALLSVSVVAMNKTAQGATQGNANTVARVIGALKGIGVPGPSIQTQGYYLNVDYSSCYQACVPTIIGYTVTNTLLVNITSSDPAQLGLGAGRAIDTAVGAGANQVSLQFSVTRSLQSSLNDQALKQAVATASGQAQVIAGSLGVTISGVISATASPSYYPAYQYPYVISAVGQAAGAVSTPIMPGTQTASATVQVIYAIS